jgi:AraC-like DNA-binding protein
MKTYNPYDIVKEGSWTEDFTPPEGIRRKYLYVQCMGFYHTEPPYQVLNRNALSSYLVLYTTRGNGVLSYRDSITELSPETLVLIDCREVHSYYPADGEWDFYWLHFYGTGAEGYLEEFFSDWSPVCLSPDWYFFADESDTSPDFFFGSILSDAKTASPLGYLSVSTRIINLISACLAEQKKNHRAESHKISPVVSDAALYLEEHVGDEVSLDLLCAHLRVSKYYLSHLFTEQIGRGPYEYLLTLRLSKAKTFLRTSDLPVSEIAVNCGFHKSSYFIQLFKTREEITPLQYRKYFRQSS